MLNAGIAKISATKKFAAVVFAANFLCGCCATHEHVRPQWEYKTLVVPNDAVPLQGSRPGWTSDDPALNAMLKKGWVVAGYSVDHINSQWFLLKRPKR